MGEFLPQAGAFWSRATAAALGLAGFHSEADEVDLQGGLPGDPMRPYRLLPCTAAMAKDKWDCPYMPHQGGNYLHTRKSGWFCYNGAASRPVTRAEIRTESQAQEAMDFEWQRLVDKGCFDFKCVFDSHKLTALARAGKRKKCHIGLVFGI